MNLYAVHDLTGAFVAYQGLQITAVPVRTLDLDIAMVAVGADWPVKGSTSEYDWTGKQIGAHFTGVLTDSAGLITMGDLATCAVHPPDNSSLCYSGSMGLSNYVMH